MADRLRALWDFNDLDVSEARFRGQLDEETTDAGRAEVLSQLARVEGLRANYERCHVLAEDYAALGRGADASDQAQRALALIGEDDGARVARLRELAG